MPGRAYEQVLHRGRRPASGGVRDHQLSGGLRPPTKRVHQPACHGWPVQDPARRALGQVLSWRSGRGLPAAGVGKRNSGNFPRGPLPSGRSAPRQPVPPAARRPVGSSNRRSGRGLPAATTARPIGRAPTRLRNSSLSRFFMYETRKHQHLTCYCNKIMV